MFETFTPEARRAIVMAEEVARAEGSTKITDRHLALACLHSPAAMAVAGATGLDLEAGRAVLEQPATKRRPTGRLKFTRATNKALTETFRQSQSMAHPSITSAHLLLGVLSGRRTEATKALATVGLDGEEVHANVARLPNLDHRDEDADLFAALVDWPLIGRQVRDELLEQHAISILMEGDLPRARAVIDTIDSESPKALPSLLMGELSGDVELVIRHAPVAIERTDDSAGTVLITRALAHAHQGEAEAARADIQAAIADDPARASIRLEATETELLLGDTGRARRHLEDANRLMRGDDNALLEAWRLTLAARLGDGLDIAELHDRLDTIRTALEGPALAVVKRIEVDLARAALAERRGDLDAAADLVQSVQREATELGFRGLALDAMVMVAGIQFAADDDVWRSTVARAVAAADELGRRVIARRLRDLG